MEEMRQAAPYDEKGIDSDNGEEFINYHLESWCREHGIKRFRSRPYKKDDQAHIEQKNGTHVRRLIGWPLMVCVPAVTTWSGAPGRPALRASNMKPAITDRAALPVHSARSSVTRLRAARRGRPHRARAARGGWRW